MVPQEKTTTQHTMEVSLGFQIYENVAGKSLVLLTFYLSCDYVLNKFWIAMLSRCSYFNMLSCVGFHMGKRMSDK